MRQLRPIPASLELAPTLARRVLQLREFRNLTLLEVAKSARFSPRRMEEIESGLETWLSATDRQLLAKALYVEPDVLKEVESRSYSEEPITASAMEELGDLILHGQRDLECPMCGNDLRCSVQEGFDLEGNPIRLPKAFCHKCPFILK
jgi:transcriptional regulator with XRE-family HTH domain